MTLDDRILEYLYREGKARQVKQIRYDLNELNADLDTTDGYVSAVLGRLKKRGLVKVSTHRGWWSLTENGEAYVTGADIKEPFFSKEQVNQSIILRGIGNTLERSKENAQHVPDDILEFFVGIYLLKHDLELPVGKDLNEEEWEIYKQVANKINQMLSEAVA